MKFVSLYSGSSGNALFAAHKRTKLLIDAGLSGKRIERGLFEIDELATELSGILVTHEHRDHIHGVGVLSRRYQLPIYTNFETWESMKNDLGKIPEDRVRIFENGVPFVVGDIQIQAFQTSHDAASPVGFVLEDGKSSMAIATDTGVITDSMKQAIHNRDLVVLESNHDQDMLDSGPYPFYLKQRIKGKNGHLSNVTCGEMVCELVDSGVETVVLAHLSQENNFPLLAYETTARILKERGITPEKDIQLTVAERDRAGKIYEF